MRSQWVGERKIVEEDGNADEEAADTTVRSFWSPGSPGTEACSAGTRGSVRVHHLGVSVGSAGTAHAFHLYGRLCGVRRALRPEGVHSAVPEQLMRSPWGTDERSLPIHIAVRAEEAVPYLGIAQVSQTGTSDGVLTDCELRLTAKITSPTYSASNPEPFVRSPSNWPREPKNCCRTELQVIRASIWSHADVIAAADSTIGRSTAGQRQHSGSGQPVGPAGPASRRQCSRRCRKSSKDSSAGQVW